MDGSKTLEQLIDEGRGLLATQKPSLNASPKVDIAAFLAWRRRSLDFLAAELPLTSRYLPCFREHVKGGHVHEVKSGIGILKAVKEELACVALPT